MIRFLHIGRRKSPVTTSALNSPLERVRDMRGHSDWEPLTNPSNIQERADRVSRAREQIAIPPLACERKTEMERLYASRLWWMHFVWPLVIGIAAFLAALLAALISYVLSD